MNDLFTCKHARGPVTSWSSWGSLSPPWWGGLTFTCKSPQELELLMHTIPQVHTRCKQASHCSVLVYISQQLMCNNTTLKVHLERNKIILPQLAEHNIVICSQVCWVFLCAVLYSCWEERSSGYVTGADIEQWHASANSPIEKLIITLGIEEHSECQSMPLNWETEKNGKSERVRGSKQTFIRANHLKACRAGEICVKPVVTPRSRMHSIRLQYEKKFWHYNNIGMYIPLNMDELLSP